MSDRRLDSFLSTTHQTPSAGVRVLPVLERGDTVGRYIVLHTLGMGSLSVVYAAYDPELNRQVALKFMHAARTDGVDSQNSSRARLLREAQAIARVNHPNVIAIYDVGTREDEVYLAEEMVTGEDLREWLATGRRSQREILEVFRQAGRGLAAAHAAGIIHRDFKPANVLVGQDGRVRVVDFGLARAADEVAGGAAVEAREPPRRADPPEGRPESAEDVLESALTQTGAMVGTPYYMAPEQHQGRVVDARGDQFGFCVSLYEALYGERPFPAMTLDELVQRVTGGEVAPPPPGATVPGWLRRILLRGLQRDPAARYPTMDALLAELGHDPRARRWQFVALGAGLLLLAGIGVGLDRYVEARLRPCSDAPRHVAEVWSPARKAALQKAFTGTRLSYAGRVWESVAQALDAYTTAWAAMHTEACEATRLHGEQSEEVLDLRMQCLSARLEETRALTEVLEHADASVMDRAAQAVHGLSPIGTCADVRGLSAPVRLPQDRATRAKVEALRNRLARIKALELAQARQGMAQIGPAVAEARQLGYGPVLAEALLRQGSLETRTGQYAPAQETFEEAVWTAIAAGDEATAALAESQLVEVTARQRRAEEGLRWARAAEATLTHLGGPQELIRARLAHGLGEAYFILKKWPASEAQYRRAIELRERLLGPDSLEVANSLSGLGNTLHDEGKALEAVAQHRRALAIWEKVVGPEHPQLARPLYYLGKAYLASGQLAMAADCLRRALTLRESFLGLTHGLVAQAHEALGRVLRAQGQYDEAAAQYRQALHAYEKTASDAAVDDWLALGELLGLKGQREEAVQAFEQGVRVAEKYPDEPEGLGAARFALARALWDTRRTERARARSLAAAARDAYAQLKEKKAELGVVEAWLAEHGGR
jgi:tetratricopeptide (TPR) repeat protein